MTLDRRVMRLDRHRPTTPVSESAVSLRTTDDVLAVLESAVSEASRDAGVDPLDKARTLGYLAGIAAKLLETRDLAGRVEAMESVLRQRERPRDARTQR